LLLSRDKALLCIAIEKGYDAIISFLFEHGANIESENKNGSNLL